MISVMCRRLTPLCPLFSFLLCIDRFPGLFIGLCVSKRRPIDFLFLFRRILLQQRGKV